MTTQAVNPTHCYPAQPSVSPVPSPFFGLFAILQATSEATMKRSSNTAKMRGRRTLSPRPSLLQTTDATNDRGWLTSPLDLIPPTWGQRWPHTFRPSDCRAVVSSLGNPYSWVPAEILFFLFLATLQGLWDFSSLTRD